MKKYFFVFLVTISLQSYAQSNTTKSKSKSLDISSQNDTVKLKFNGESYNIPVKKFDSLANRMLESFFTIINDKDNQKMIKESVDKMGTKLDKAIDILIDDPSQREKAKKDLKASLKDSKPLIDTAIKKLNEKNTTSK